jgi:hypothetical protein
MIQDFQEYDDDFMGLRPCNYMMQRYYLGLLDWIILEITGLIGEVIQSLAYSRS